MSLPKAKRNIEGSTGPLEAAQKMAAITGGISINPIVIWRTERKATYCQIWGGNETLLVTYKL